MRRTKTLLNLSPSQRRMLLASVIGLSCFLAAAALADSPKEKVEDEFLLRLDREARETSTAKSWRQSGMIKLMYKRSPILRAALSPNREATPVKPSERLAMEITRIRAISNLEQKSVMALSDTPVTSASLPFCSREVSEEIDRIETVVLELISHFQEYQESIESRLVTFRLESDRRMDEMVEKKVKAVERGLRDFVEKDMLPVMKPPDVQRLRDEFARLKEDQYRLTEKVRRMSELNCESHLKSSATLKALQTSLINR